jgi:hypothetical protein
LIQLARNNVTYGEKLHFTSAEVQFTSWMA